MIQSLVGRDSIVIQSLFNCFSVVIQWLFNRYSDVIQSLFNRCSIVTESLLSRYSIAISYSVVTQTLFLKSCVAISLHDRVPKQGHQVCVGRTAKINFSVVVGWVPGQPDAAMFRVGVSIEASFNFNGCSGALNFSLGAGLIGAVIWKSTGCPFGPSLWIFNCVTGAALGLTVFCCNYNLLNGSSNCR